jgi:hypothetical protein
MSESSYEFDPCSIDGSDTDKEEITLDSWKPTKNESKIVFSKWRQDSIGTNFNQDPGIDELRKIHMYLKKKVSDSDIMKAFGINCETLVAIKKNKYDPVDGISLDNQSKIYKEFKRLENRIESLLRGINYIGKCLFLDKNDEAEFKKSFKKIKKYKESKKNKSEINEICEDFCDLDDEICEEK